ncbi:RDD family protein [Lysobacter sp. H21R4]|uniref:RDD family protein n=1 Tax=Lysobacter sp. H21R4 TaxID=2781021 RepID=UPI001886FAA5|nr:RDD family protein [Lysobacter sp. H21R4]QOY63106.1 RDD family protein [Lysobacter sp. H21R4]
MNPAPAPSSRAPRHPATHSASPLLGWRLLALVYDFFPALGLWLLVAAMFVAAHHDAITGGLLGSLEFIALWLVTAGYSMASWRFGGQTLGMRPWRLQVVGADGGVPSWRTLLVRYAVGNLSLLLGGLGFWWAWWDRDGLTWHDRASGTRMRRLAKAD